MTDMTDLNFKLEVFEGPLDLMLSLIAKHKLNIQDIEISVLLEQFLLYLAQMQDAEIEVAGEFMEMAARLIYIKSAALLPKHQVEELKKELEGRLIEYALCKKVAERLKKSFIGNDIFVRAPMAVEVDKSYKNIHEIDELFYVYTQLSIREKAIHTPPSMRPMIAHSYVSVFTKVVYVLKRIQRKEKVSVNSLYSGQTRSEKVATFLALLELSKYNRVRFSEDNLYLEFVGKDGNIAENAVNDNEGGNSEQEIVDEETRFVFDE